MVFQYPVAREGRESGYFLGLGSQPFRFDLLGAGLKLYRWRCFRRAYGGPYRMDIHERIYEIFTFFYQWFIKISILKNVDWY